jgi:hypothetical protein
MLLLGRNGQSHQTRSGIVGCCVALRAAMLAAAPPSVTISSRPECGLPCDPSTGGMTLQLKRMVSRFDYAVCDKSAYPLKLSVNADMLARQRSAKTGREQLQQTTCANAAIRSPRRHG